MLQLVIAKLDLVQENGDGNDDVVGDGDGGPDVHVPIGHPIIGAR